MYLMDLPPMNKYETIQRDCSDAYDVIIEEEDDEFFFLPELSDEDNAILDQYEMSGY